MFFKIFVLIISLLLGQFWLVAQNKATKKPSTTNYQEIYEKLPATSYTIKNGQKLQKDEYKCRLPQKISTKDKAELYYKGRKIWSDTAHFPSISVSEEKGLCLLKKSTPDGYYVSNLFFKGENITGKIRPKGCPNLYDFKIKNDYAYFIFVDRSNDWSHQLPTFAGYNLKTGKISFQEPENFQAKFEALPEPEIILNLGDGKNLIAKSANLLLVKISDQSDDNQKTAAFFKGENIIDRLVWSNRVIVGFREDAANNFIYFKYDDNGQTLYGRFDLKESIYTGLRFPGQKY